MQADNYNYKPDEQFTNRGWEEMQRKLDKEMPVEKKKRRGIFWFYLLGFYLLGFLLLVSGIGFFTYNKYQITTPNKNQKVYAETQEIGNKNSIQNANQNIKDENNLTINKTNNDVVEVEGNSNESRTVSTSKTSKPIFYNNKNTDNDFLNDDVKQPIVSSSINSNVIIENPNSKSSESFFDVVELEEPIALRASLTMNSIDFLQIYLKEKEQQNLTIDESELEIGKAKIVKYNQPKKRKINFGLNAGGLLDMENNQKIGTFASAFVHFPIGKKLGIRTGLGYSLINKDLNYQFSDVQDATYFEPNSSSFDTTSVNSIGVRTETLFKLERFHYLEIPLLLTYQIHEKWQFQLGVNGSFLIQDDLSSIESGYQFADETEADDLGIELAAVSELTVDFEQFQKQDFWKKWNMNAVFGMSFKINLRWNIELQYHRSFSRFLETDEDGIFADQFAVDPNQLFPIGSSTNIGVYSVQNEASISSNSLTFDSSSAKELNINHSLRIAIGYSF